MLGLCEGFVRLFLSDYVNDDNIISFFFFYLNLSFTCLLIYYYTGY